MTYFVADTEKSITYKETPPKAPSEHVVASGSFDDEGIHFDPGSNVTPRLLSRVVEEFKFVHNHSPAYFVQAGVTHRLGGWC